MLARRPAKAPSIGVTVVMGESKRRGERSDLSVASAAVGGQFELSGSETRRGVGSTTLRAIGEAAGLRADVDGNVRGG